MLIVVLIISIIDSSSIIPGIYLYAQEVLKAQAN